MCRHRLARAWGAVLLAAWGAAAQGGTPAAATTAPPPAPARGAQRPAAAGTGAALAVLDLEVTGDTSDAARTAEWDTRRLRLTRALREAIAASGAYRVVDNAAAAPLISRLAATQPLHRCNGCERDIADALGARYVMVGDVFRMSQLVLTLHVRIIDAADGREAWRHDLQFRGDNDASWARAVDYLVKDMTQAH